MKLIPHSWTTQVNEQHQVAVERIMSSDEVDTLKAHWVKQLQDAELTLITAYEKLLQKYAHAQSLSEALEVRCINEPNVHLTGLLMSAGIETENDEDQQGNMY